MASRDINPKPVLTVASIPSGTNQVTGANITISAGSYGVFKISTIPDSDRLGLFNFFPSFYIDALDNDHLWPNTSAVDGYGGSLTSVVMTNIFISFVPDWARSSDTTNRRVSLATIINTDSSSHVIYLYFKSYTFSAITGGNA